VVIADLIRNLLIICFYLFFWPFIVMMNSPMINGFYLLGIPGQARNDVKRGRDHCELHPQSLEHMPLSQQLNFHLRLLTR
jgi:hypothetical protein